MVIPNISVSDQSCHMGLRRLCNVLLQEMPLTASSMRNLIPDRSYWHWDGIARIMIQLGKFRPGEKKNKFFQSFFGKEVVMKLGLFNTNIDFENWVPIHGPRPTLTFNFQCFQDIYTFYFTRMRKLYFMFQRCGDTSEWVLLLYLEQ